MDVQVVRVKIMVNINSINNTNLFNFLCIFFCLQGTCVDSVSDLACICPSGWTGKFCDTDINECIAPTPCNPNATCINTIGSYTCLCPPWLTGFNCYTPIDLCASFPCRNNGVCVYNYGSLPTCRCQSGFTGVYCEVRK